MSSILANIEDSISTADVYCVTRQLYNRLINREQVHQAVREYCHRYQNYTEGRAFESLVNDIYNNMIHDTRDIRIGTLIDKYEFTVNDLILFCESQYVKELNDITACNFEFGIGIESNFNKAIMYLNDTQDTIDFTKYGFYKFGIFVDSDGNTENTLLTNGDTARQQEAMRKMILCPQLLFSKVFYDEMRKYANKKLTDFISNYCIL